MDARRDPAAVAVMVIGVGTVWRSTPEDEATAALGTAEQAEIGHDRQPPPSVQVEMANERVRVYQFAEDGDGDSAVYFIVNPALES